MTDQLQILLDALNRNAAAFRRAGHHDCADRSEHIAARLAEAMKETPSEPARTA
jgi:hypothetical protein